MEHDATLIQAQEGASRARVTQVVNLLRLFAEIQTGLLNPPVPLGIHSFSEMRLQRAVSSKDAEISFSRWRELLQELKASAYI